MNTVIFTDWYRNVFIQSVKKYHEKEGKERNVSLILDNAPMHPSAELLNSIDDGSEVMFLPPNVTPLIQPMDQGIIEKLKRMYRKQVLCPLLLAEDNEESVVTFAIKLNIKDSIYMFADSWEMLTKDNLRKGWNKLWATMPIFDNANVYQPENGEGQILGEVSILSMPLYVNPWVS